MALLRCAPPPKGAIWAYHISAQVTDLGAVQGFRRLNGPLASGGPRRWIELSGEAVDGAEIEGAPVMLAECGWSGPLL